MSDLTNFNALMGQATARPWAWEVEDYSAISLQGPGGELNHVFTHGPCKSCQQSATPKDWEFGRCTTISETNARLLTLAANNVQALVEMVEKQAREIHRRNTPPELRGYYGLDVCTARECVEARELLAKIESEAKQ